VQYLSFCYCLWNFMVTLSSPPRVFPPMHPSETPISQETALSYQAELQLLRTQFRGDFLCNTLVLLRSKLSEKPPCSSELTTVMDGMCDYYRYALASLQEGTVPLSEEWEAVSGYLAVQKARFGDQLELDCKISKQAMAFPIPRIFLQPLVDNAVTHGRRTSEPPAKIRISASCPDKKTLCIEVTNTGLWNDEPGIIPRHPSVSLENLKRRLALLYPGKKHRMEITDKDDWITVKTRISIA